MYVYQKRFDNEEIDWIRMFEDTERIYHFLELLSLETDYKAFVIGILQESDKKVGRKLGGKELIKGITLYDMSPCIEIEFDDGPILARYEGKQFDKVIEERGGYLGKLADYFGIRAKRDQVNSSKFVFSFNPDNYKKEEAT